MRNPIVYDETAAPDAAELARWGRALSLPARNWRTIRRLLGRTTALGYNRAGICDWVIKGGAGTRPHRTNFEAMVNNARLLRDLARETGASWLATADPEAYRRGEAGGFDLIAAPYLPGLPLAAEHRLCVGEMTTLAADAASMIKIMRWLENRTETLSSSSAFADRPPFAPEPYIARISARLEVRLRALVAEDGLEAAQARKISNEFDRRLAVVPLRPTFAHGELTPWHVLHRGDGRISLIDLETMGLDVAGEDLSVLVMRTWALCAAPAVAELFLKTRRSLEGAGDRDRFDAELAWQWLYGAVRTRKESMSWRVRDEAESFWHHFLDEVLSPRARARDSFHVSASA